MRKYTYVYVPSERRLKVIAPTIPRGPVSPSFTRDFSVIYITFIERLILGLVIGRVQFDSITFVTHLLCARRFCRRKDLSAFSHNFNSRYGISRKPRAWSSKFINQSPLESKLSGKTLLLIAASRSHKQPSHMSPSLSSRRRRSRRGSVTLLFSRVRDTILEFFLYSMYYDATIYIQRRNREGRGEGKNER